MKFQSELRLQNGVYEMGRINNKIQGYNGYGFVEIDTKHLISYRTNLEGNPISVRCFPYYGKSCHFIITLKQIQLNTSEILMSSNEFAQFTQNIDVLENSMTFAKFHLNHLKYSLNYMSQNGNKTIIRLFDECPSTLALNKYKPDILFSIGTSAFMVPLERSNNFGVLWEKTGKLLHDQHFVYEIQKKQSGYCCYLHGMKDYKPTQKLSLMEEPIKIQSFKHTILVSSSRNLAIYDHRKLFSPLLKQQTKGLLDFLYEPNLNLIYCGLNNGLRVYNF